jgi:prolipoprotein diacylglyceryltransferase
MYPILFRLGPLTLYSFGAFMALAALTAAWVVKREAAASRLQSGISLEPGFRAPPWAVLSVRVCCSSLRSGRGLSLHP